MAPYDNPPSATLTTKISPLIDGQLPDFVRDENPLFSKLLQYYYEYLEAAELLVDAQVDNILQETVDVQYILDEDGNQIVYEDSEGKFTVGETITGSKSKATATILIDDQRNNRLFITSTQQFITGETIVGATSTSEGTITRYRGNPVQNIQQLLDYADTDRTIGDFLDQLSTSFMTAIPKSTVGYNPQNTTNPTLDRRNLIKNIRELYRLKGTSESFELFIRILLNLDAEIVYPRKFMMRASDGNFSRDLIIRTTAISDAQGDEIVSQKITGVTSGATAIVAQSATLTQNGVDITEFTISYKDGDFIVGEKITSISLTRNVIQEFTILNILKEVSVDNNGILYSSTEDIDINDDFGNASATAEVSSIKTGSVSGVIIDNVGTGYKIGDPLVFASTQDNVSLPTGFVSVVDGAIALDGTDDSSTDADDYLVYEDGTTEHLETFEFALESGLNDEATAITNGAVENSTTVILDNNVGTIIKGMTVYGAGLTEGITVITVTSQTNIIISERITLANDVSLRFVDPAGILRLETGGLSTATDLGHSLISEFLPDPVSDEYTTGADQMILEDATVDLGEIKRVHLTNKGNGFTSLPTVTIDQAVGTKFLAADGTYDDPVTAVLFSTTTDIGAIDEIIVKDEGANYSTTELPDVIARANFVVKDVSGTFVAGESLTTHTGTVQSFDANTQVLQTTIEDVVRIPLETTDALPISLEDASGSIESYFTLSGGGTDDGFYDEGFPHTGIVDETDGEPIVLNADELTGDAFIALEDDTGDILRTEPNSFIEKTFFLLEDNSGVLVREDAEETTKKFIREFPRGRQPARTWLDTVQFTAGRKISDTEFEPPRITPTSAYLTDQSWKDTFGVHVPTLTHKATATALVDGKTATQSVTLDNNSGTIDEQMFVTGTVATAIVNVDAVDSFDVTVVVSTGTIQAGLVVEGTGIPVGTIVQSVSTTEIFTLNTRVTLSEDAALTFKLPSSTVVQDVTSQTSITLSTLPNGLAITLADNTSLSFESPSTNGPFVNGEEITGGTSGATALILDAAADMKFISSNGIDFVVGETITGESKVDVDGNVVTAQAIIQTLGQTFIVSPESIWTEFRIETITEKNAPLLEDASSDVVFSKESEEIVLESAGPFRNFTISEDHLVLDGTDEVINASGSGFSSGRTNAGGRIVEEASGDTIILEINEAEAVTIGFSKQSTFDFYDGQNFGIILDGDFDDTGKILLDGTDTNGSNAGSEIIDESSNAGGTGSIGVIELEEGGILLGEIEPETGVLALDGFNSSAKHAGSSVIHEVDGIDFSAGTTTITASGGFSATIVTADIAKATASVNTFRTDTSGYGSDISSILGEDLNRLQDSLFYQQFSYEVQTGVGANAYLDELKKAVHPSGFAVFGKVKIAQQLEDINPVLNSKLMTISSFVGDQPIAVKRALAAFEMTPGSLQDVIVQEDSLSTGIVEFLALDGTDGSGKDAGDNILEESATSGTTTNNLILNATDFNEGDDRGDILLDGTDSDGTDAGSSLELEDELHEPKNKIVFERIDNPNGINHNAIINEDGGFIVPETSPISGSGPLRFGETTDVSVINTTTLQVATKASSGPSTASLGVVGLATPFGGADALETELGTISSKAPQEAHQKRRIGIIPTFFPVDIRQEGQLLSEDAGSGPELADISTFPLADFVRTGIIDIGEDATNTNVTSETVGILLEQTEAGSFKQEDGTTVASTHGDDILLENATGPNLNEKLLLESLRIELEDNTSKTGVVPFQNFGENTFDNLAISSDILSEEGLSVALEDNSGPDHILLDGTNENAENAGFFLIDESGTGFQILFESVETGHSDNTGIIIFDGAEDIIGLEQLITEDGFDIVLDATDFAQDEGGIDIFGAGTKLVTDGDFVVQNVGDKALFELQTRSDILNNSSYTVPGIPTFDSSLVSMDSSLDMSIV